MMRKLVTLGIVLMSGMMLACGGAEPQVNSTAPNQEPETTAAPEQNVQIKGLWGKIDDSIVEQTFQRYFNDFISCYQSEALEILEEIEGSLDVYLIVGPDGQVTDDIYFENGNLGSDAAQNCLIGKIKRIPFQKPIGGYHAKVRYSIPFEEPYDHPEPIDWSGEPIEKAVEEHREEVDACLSGQSRITLTVYVGRGGRVMAAGGTAHSKEGYEAARCLSRVAKSWSFEQPHKRKPAKATIQF